MGIEAFIRFYSFIKKTSIYNDYDLSVLRAKTIAPCYSIVVIRYKLFLFFLKIFIYNNYKCRRHYYVV
jgi:hypothetical protein